MAAQSGLHFGWVVLAATFYLNLVVDGYCFVFGILRLFIAEDYPDYSPWMISIIGGLVPTIYLTFAPICIAVNEFLGPTRVIIFASCISTVAFILAWANAFLKAGFFFDLFMMGIFQGIASALLYGPSIAVIVDYFPDNQRGLASGITTCGSPVGAIFYSIIIPPLFEAYGWRGSLAVFAGLTLNGIVCSLAFMQSLKPKKNTRRHHRKHPQMKIGEVQEVELGQVKQADVSDDESYHRPEDDRESVPIPPCHILNKIKEDKLRSRLDTNHSLDNAIITHENLLVRAAIRRQQQLVADSKNSVKQVVIEEGSSSSEEEVKVPQKPQRPPVEAPPPYSRQTSKLSFQGFQSVVWLASIVMDAPRTFVDVLKKYFNAKLVCQVSFLSLLGAAIFSIVGYYVPMLLVVSQSQKAEWGVSPIIQNNLVLIWGIFNTIGRAATGKLVDLGRNYAIFTSYWIFIIGHVVSALALLIFPHVMFMGDVSFVAFVVIYGFFIAPLVTMRSVIVSDLYGKDNASASFGWFLCIQGLVQILGFILPTWLDSLAALYAYLFGAACFLLSAGFVGLTFKPYFAARKQTIEEEEAKRRNATLITGKTAA